MAKKYTNNDVYDFLTEECQLNKALWKEYGKGNYVITTHTNNGLKNNLKRSYGRQ